MGKARTEAKGSVRRKRSLLDSESSRYRASGSIATERRFRSGPHVQVVKIVVVEPCGEFVGPRRIVERGEITELLADLAERHLKRRGGRGAGGLVAPAVVMIFARKGAVDR